MNPALLLIATGGLLALGNCTFSPLEPGPSVLEHAAPRQVFPIPGPNGETQYINRLGKIVNPTPERKNPQALIPFKELVDGHPRYSYRDTSGTVKIPPKFADALEFSEHLAGVKDAAGKWGFIEESGEMRISPQFQGVGDFRQGLAPVDLCDSCSYIDRGGKQAFSGRYRHCCRFDRGVAKVEIKSGQWGFLDKTGTVLAIVSTNGEFLLFSEGLLPSEKDGGGIGFVNQSGTFVIQPKFAFVQPFSDGLAGVKEENAWGYVDKTGKYAISPQFCDPEDPRGGYFHEGLAFVCDPKTKSYGFVNRDGKYAIAPRFERCNDSSGAHCSFDGGLAWVETKLREGYINRVGKFVWSISVGRARPGR